MILPELANQSLIIESGKQFSNNFVEDTKHLEEVMAVFFFFNLLLTHHLYLQSCSEVHFSWTNDFLSHNASLNQLIFHLLQLSSHTFQAFVDCSFKFLQKLQVFLVEFLIGEVLKQLYQVFLSETQDLIRKKLNQLSFFLLNQHFLVIFIVKKTASNVFLNGFFNHLIFFGLQLRFQLRSQLRKDYYAADEIDAIGHGNDLSLK